MRTWGSLLLAADLLAFFVLLIPRGHGKLQARLVPFMYSWHLGWLSRIVLQKARGGECCRLMH